MMRSSSRSLPETGSSFPSAAMAVRSRENCSSCLESRTGSGSFPRLLLGPEQFSPPK